MLYAVCVLNLQALSDRNVQTPVPVTWYLGIKVTSLGCLAFRLPWKPCGLWVNKHIGKSWALAAVFLLPPPGLSATSIQRFVTHQPVLQQRKQWNSLRFPHQRHQVSPPCQPWTVPMGIALRERQCMPFIQQGCPYRLAFL